MTWQSVGMEAVNFFLVSPMRWQSIALWRLQLRALVWPKPGSHRAGRLQSEASVCRDLDTEPVSCRETASLGLERLSSGTRWFLALAW